MSQNSSQNTPLGLGHNPAAHCHSERTITPGNIANPAQTKKLIELIQLCTKASESNVANQFKEIMDGCGIDHSTRIR